MTIRQFVVVQGLPVHVTETEVYRDGRTRPRIRFRAQTEELDETLARDLERSLLGRSRDGDPQFVLGHGKYIPADDDELEGLRAHAEAGGGIDGPRLVALLERLVEAEEQLGSALRQLEGQTKAHAVEREIYRAAAGPMPDIVVVPAPSSWGDEDEGDEP